MLRPAEGLRACRASSEAAPSAVLASGGTSSTRVATWNSLDMRLCFVRAGKAHVEVLDVFLHDVERASADRIGSGVLPRSGLRLNRRLRADERLSAPAQRTVGCPLLGAAEQAFWRRVEVSEACHDGRWLQGAAHGQHGRQWGARQPSPTAAVDARYSRNTHSDRLGRAGLCGAAAIAPILAF